MAKPIIAILYDFDKTLSTHDMQEYDFIKNLEQTPAQFWGETTVITDKHEMDRILAYMLNMVIQCKKKNIPLTREYLNECGKSVVLYKGVQTWFERINEYAQSIGAVVEHYVISSGITEIIEGTSIANYFSKVYGCKFVYDDNGEAIWPALSINYTQKTQFIYRISKDVLGVNQDEDLNKHSEQKRRIQFENMIYIGDGLTDIPCMKLVRERGGRAIALYQSGKREVAKQLVDDERINYVCVADYSENGTLEKIVKQMIEYRVLCYNLQDKEERQIKQFIGTSQAVAEEK